MIDIVDLTLAYYANNHKISHKKFPSICIHIELNEFQTVKLQ